MLNAYRAMGRMAAALHKAGYIHGDLQPENFTFELDGEIASMFHLGRSCNPARPLSALERASDLTVLKKRSSFLQWEFAKLGYRSEVSDADEVLEYFKQQ